MRIFPLSAICLLAALLAAAPAWAAEPKPKEAGFGKAKSGDPMLSKAQLRDCLAQQAKVKTQDDEMESKKAALAAEQAELGRLGESLAGQLAALDRTSAEAVSAYNEQAQARDKRIDAHGANVDQYNARAAALNTEREAFAKTCNNRRYLEDDETALKKGR
jgi:hypothetical protein